MFLLRILMIVLNYMCYLTYALNILVLYIYIVKMLIICQTNAGGDLWMTINMVIGIYWVA